MFVLFITEKKNVGPNSANLYKSFDPSNEFIDSFDFSRISNEGCRNNDMNVDCDMVHAFDALYFS